jgi:hypothetical protein
MPMDPVVSPATGTAAARGRCFGTYGRVQITVPRAETRQRRGQDDRVEEHGAADLPTANQAG